MQVYPDPTNIYIKKKKKKKKKKTEMNYTKVQPLYYMPVLPTIHNQQS